MKQSEEDERTKRKMPAKHKKDKVLSKRAKEERSDDDELMEGNFHKFNA